MDSGNFMYKITYADPTNMGRSSYIRTVGIAADIFSTDPMNGNNWVHTNNFKTMREGVSIPPIPNINQYVNQKMENFDPFNEARSLDEHLVNAYNKRVDKEIKKGNTMGGYVDADTKKTIARDLYKQDAQKNSLNMLGGLKLGVTAKVMLQFEYAYDESLKEHVFVGGQWLIAGTLSVNRTFYWIVCGVPIFVDITGIVSLEIDGAFLPPKKEEGSTPITQEEMNAESNVLDSRFRPEGSVPWTTFTGMLIIKPGIGFCGVLDAHGTLSLSLMIRWVYLSPDQYKARVGSDEAKSYGVMVDFSGGIGVTLLVIKVEFTLGSIKQGWGILNTNGPITGGPRLSSDDYEETESIGFVADLQPLEVGSERDAQHDAQLMSTLKQISKKTIRANTGEAVTPKAVQISEAGDVFVAYVGTGEGRDAMNAPTLKYMIRDAATGEYSEPKAVDDNGVGDTTPAILLDSEAGKIYAAWTSAEEKIDSLEDLEDTDDSPETIQRVKDALNKLEIYLKAYDIATGTWGEKIRVTNDAYVDSDVRLVKENDGIALYYFKRNLENINKAEDLVSVTKNYTAWAKKVYLPEENKFAVQGTYAQADGAGHKAGDPYDEKVIEFVHPTVQDPLVLDLATAGYTYQFQESDPVGNYSFYLYSVDTDGKLDTTADRQIWLQVTNLDQNKQYYPVLLDSDQKDVAAPQLISQGNELYIAWVRDSSTLNLIDVRSVMDNMRDPANTEEGQAVPAYAESILGVYGSATQSQVSQRFWYRGLLQSMADADEDIVGLAAKIVDDDFPIQTRDFGDGSADDANREENPISGYQLLVGNDGNLYLFWTSSSPKVKEDEESILYASTYFKPSAEWTAKYGEDVGNVAFSDPVAISNTGVMINELCTVVAPDSAALLLANTYERKYVEPVEEEDFKKDPYQNGPHNLAEFVFEPVGSLNVENFTISDEFPKEGEDIVFTWNVKNAGLLPAIGRSVELKVTNGSTVLWKYEDEVKGQPLYVGESVAYETDAWTVPAGLDMNKVELTLTVKELDEAGNALGEETILKNQLTQAADVVYLEPYVQDYNEFSDMLLDYLYANNADLTYDPDSGEEYTAADVAAYLAALEKTLKEEAPELATPEVLKTLEEDPLILSELFDYVTYLPVGNLGNKTANLTAKLRFVNDSLEETNEVIGETLLPVSLAPMVAGDVALLQVDTDTVEVDDSVDYLVIPIKLTKDRFDDYGIVRGVIDVYDGEEKVLEDIDVTISADGVVDFVLKDADTVVTMKRGSTYQVQTEAYPYEDLKAMVYESTDPDVATVDENGRVTAVGEGEATILAYELGSGKIHGFTVKVGEGQLPSECPKDETCPMTAYSDLTPTAWYHDGVHWALDNKVMNGMSATTFVPDGQTTRGQLVTMLWRMEGEPDPDYAATFKDVPANAYYAKAVSWAAKNKIVTGYDAETFAPEDKLSREQLATILYRYAKYQGIDVTATEDALGSFKDAGQVHDWAEDALNWAVKVGIINGMSKDQLGPQGSATRAQVATMLMRYALSL